MIKRPLNEFLREGMNFFKHHHNTMGSDPRNIEFVRDFSRRITICNIRQKNQHLFSKWKATTWAWLYCSGVQGFKKSMQLFKVSLVHPAMRLEKSHCPCGRTRQEKSHCWGQDHSCDQLKLMPCASQIKERNKTFSLVHSNHDVSHIMIMTIWYIMIPDSVHPQQFS